LPFKIFDFHAHLPAPEPVALSRSWPRAFKHRYGEEKWGMLKKRWRERQRSWWNIYGFPEPEEPQPPPREAADRYAMEVERHGLIGIAFLTGGGNETLAKAIQPYPRLHGLAHHDPFGPNAPEELAFAVKELGLRGYKIIAPLLIDKLTDPKLDKLWQTCADLKIPVVIHFGPLNPPGIVSGANIDPLTLHDIAKGFPEIAFVVPHFGTGYLRELLHLMWSCENVYVDTSGSNRWARYMWPQPTLKDLFRLFYELFGAERIIFGTDSSHFPRGWVEPYFWEQYRAALEAGIPEEGIEKVFRENALQLLHL